MLGDEDAALYFVDGEFAQEVLIGPYGNERRILAIFDNLPFQEDAGESLFTGNQPVLTCQTVDVATTGPETRVSIAGVDYYVIENQPDGTGVSRLYLRKANANG